MKQSVFQGPLLVDGDRLTLDEALRLALQHSDIARTIDSDEVVVEEATGYDASISRETINEALAAFDTNLETTFSWNRFEGPPNSFFGPGIDREDRRDEATLATGLTKLWDRGTQTRIAYNPTPGYLFFPGGSTGFNPSHVSALEIEARQPLLQGGGLAVNYAPINVARLQTDQTAWEFKEALLEMVLSVEQAYWELYAARVARDVLEEQTPMIDEVVRIEEANLEAERSVAADVAKARTQLYRLRQRKVEANRVIREKELQLGSLIGLGPHRHVAMVPVTPPPSAPIWLDKQASITRAINNQPVLIQRRIETRVSELEIMLARNQYLPRLELQALYRANGLEDDLGNSLEMMLDQDFYDWQFGAAFSVPLGRNGPRAKLRAAEMQLARANAQLREEVRLTIFEINTIVARIEGLHKEYRAAKEREKQAREWLRGAKIRYKNPPPAGRSVNWMLIALNDLLFALQASSDAAEEAAVLLANYNTELARLQQVEGSLLGKYHVCLQEEPCSSEVIEQLPEIKLPKENLDQPKDQEKQEEKENKKDTLADFSGLSLEAEYTPWSAPHESEPWPSSEESVPWSSEPESEPWPKPRSSDDAVDPHRVGDVQQFTSLGTTPPSARITGVRAIGSKWESSTVSSQIKDLPIIDALPVVEELPEPLPSVMPEFVSNPYAYPTTELTKRRRSEGETESR